MFLPKKIDTTTLKMIYLVLILGTVLLLFPLSKILMKNMENMFEVPVPRRKKPDTDAEGFATDPIAALKKLQE